MLQLKQRVLASYHHLDQVAKSHPSCPLLSLSCLSRPSNPLSRQPPFPHTSQQRMNEELRYQDSHADRIRNDADTLGYKLSNVNREGFKRI